MSTRKKETELTEDEVNDHVETLRGYIGGNQPGLMGARGPEGAPDLDHALAAAVKLPQRPKGMPIGDWIKILTQLLAILGPFFNKNEPA